MRAKEDNKKRETEVEENRRQKSEENQVRENEDRLIGLESRESLICSVLMIGMDHINNLKVKGIWVLIFYHFELERLKGSQKKVELVEAVTDLFQR